MDDVSAFEIISSISIHSTSPKSQVRYSWNDFQDRILKCPNQVTDLLFLQALVIPHPIIPLKVISTMMKIKRDIVSAESAKLLTCMTWIPLDYVRHILFLEQEHVREISDELSFKAQIWLKVFDPLKETCAIPPRLTITEIIIRWLHSDSEVWESVLGSCSSHERNLPYLVQLLEITSHEMNGPFSETIQRRICEITIHKIVSFWEDRAAENALRKLYSIHQLQNAFGLSNLVKSSALKISFQRSMFYTSKYIMSLCPYTVLGFDPRSNVENKCDRNFLFDILKENHQEKTIDILKCYIELYIYSSLDLVFTFKGSDRAQMENCFFYACGGLFYRYFNLQNGYLDSPSLIVQNEYGDYSEELHRGIIHYLMNFERTCSKHQHTKETLDLCIQWHLMALLNFAVKNTMWSFINWAIYEYPLILFAKEHGDHYDCKGGTLLHILCSSRCAPSSLIESVIEQSIENGITRGGLIIKNDYDETPIEIIGKKKGPQILKLFNYLMNHESKRLVIQSDFTDRYLFHAICRGGQPSVARKFIKMFPNILSVVDSCGRLPLHVIFLGNSATNPHILRLLLKEGLKQEIGKNQGGMAGLLVKDTCGLTPLDYLVKKEPNSSNSLVKVLFSGIVNNVPLLTLLLSQIELRLPIPQQAESIKLWAVHRFFLEKNLSSILESFPMCIHIPGPDGRYPIHVAIDIGFGEFGRESSLRNYLHVQSNICSYSAEAYIAIRNESSHLSCIDPITGLYPFQMIATKGFFQNTLACDRSKRINALSEIFTMLSLDPSAIVIQSQMNAFNKPIRKRLKQSTLKDYFRSEIKTVNIQISF